MMTWEKDQVVELTNDDCHDCGALSGFLGKRLILAEMWNRTVWRTRDNHYVCSKCAKRVMVSMIDGTEHLEDQPLCKKYNCVPKVSPSFAIGTTVKLVRGCSKCGSVPALKVGDELIIIADSGYRYTAVSKRDVKQWTVCNDCIEKVADPNTADLQYGDVVWYDGGLSRVVYVDEGVGDVLLEGYSELIPMESAILMRPTEISVGNVVIFKGDLCVVRQGINRFRLESLRHPYILPIFLNFGDVQVLRAEGQLKRIF